MKKYDKNSRFYPQTLEEQFAQVFNCLPFHGHITALNEKTNKRIYSKVNILYAQLLKFLQYQDFCCMYLHVVYKTE